MNVGNILKVADAIERAELVSSGIGFSMGSFREVGGGLLDQTGHECGTVACIAGWAVALIDGVHEYERCPFVDDRATELLGLTRRGLFEGQAGELFFPKDSADPMYTQAVAARCLRNLAITGKVDWEAAMKPADPVMPSLPSPVPADKVRA